MDVDSGASASAAGKTKWFTDLNMQTYRDNMEVNVRGLLVFNYALYHDMLC